RASAALSSPVIASSIRAAMTSRTARPNCQRLGRDLLRSRQRNLNNALGRSLKVIGTTYRRIRWDYSLQTDTMSALGHQWTSRLAQGRVRFTPENAYC